MKLPKFFIEGRKGKDGKIHSSDARFLKGCIKGWFGKDLDLSENFALIGGASEYNTMAPDIRRSESFQVIMIIDGNGNPSKRKQEIIEFQKSESLNFPFFLFPNDKDIGELETLLETIAVKKDFLKCFNDYQKCIGKELDIKEKIFAYIRAHEKKKDAATEINRDFTTGGFDLNHDALSPLKVFLSQFF